MRPQVIHILLLFVSGCAAAPERHPETPPPAPDFGASAPSVQAEEPLGPAPDLTDSPALDALLRAALERSPRIRAAKQRALAAAEAPAIGSGLPDPRVLVGWYETPVETRVGPQRWSLSVQQAVPFPTKLGKQAEIGRAEARRATVGYERAVRDVLAEVVKSAWEIAYLDRAAAITDEIGAILDRYATAAAANETGSPVSELFRAETQQAQLENDRVMLAELRAAEAEHLRSLLALPVGAAIGTPRTGEVPPIDAEFGELLAIARKENQELAEAGLAHEAAELRAELATQRRLPDLTFGLTRIFTDELDPAYGDPPDNGQDAMILTAGATLPIWLPKDNAAIRQARANERAAALERMDAVQRVRDRLARAWFRLRNADRLHRLYRDVLVPRARAAASTSEDLLATGKGTLAGTLETVAVYHQFRLAAARARADHGQALADLEVAIGRPFQLDTEAAR